MCTVFLFIDLFWGTVLRSMGLEPRRVLIDLAESSLHLVSSLCLLISYHVYVSDGFHDRQCCFLMYIILQRVFEVVKYMMRNFKFRKSEVYVIKFHEP